MLPLDAVVFVALKTAMSNNSKAYRCADQFTRGCGDPKGCREQNAGCDRVFRRRSLVAAFGM